METPVIFLPIAIILGIMVLAIYEIGKYYFKKLSQYIKDATFK
jgi:4-amino-4-deoxy-L-arabinose transferase-like glycosyltransferase